MNSVPGSQTTRKASVCRSDVHMRISCSAAIHIHTCVSAVLKHLSVSDSRPVIFMTHHEYKNALCKPALSVTYSQLVVKKYMALFFIKSLIQYQHTHTTQFRIHFVRVQQDGEVGAKTI